MSIELGTIVRDRISEYEGVAVARVEYLTGCNRIGVQAKVSADGKVPDAVYFDEQMLLVVGPHRVLEIPPADLAKLRETGGPQAAPRNRPDPK